MISKSSDDLTGLSKIAFTLNGSFLMERNRENLFKIENTFNTFLDHFVYHSYAWAMKHFRNWIQDGKFKMVRSASKNPGITGR